MRQWRLIYDRPTIGSMNMALDEAILQSVSAHATMPALRLYGWEPLCLSLGYGQRLSDIDTVRLAEREWGFVRRPTGGRAILHGDELTYSVALPMDHELAQGDIIESYRQISQALVAAMELLGLVPQSERRDGPSSARGPVCFEVPSHYEITAGGRKLIGSAQVRRRDGLLQHGTLPLLGDVGRICDALSYEDEAARELARTQVRQRAITLSEALQREISWDEAAQALIGGFESALGVSFVESWFEPAELSRAATLEHDVYAPQTEWTSKR